MCVLVFFLQSRTLEESLLWQVTSASQELYPQLSLVAAVTLTSPDQTVEIERLSPQLEFFRKIIE